MKFPRQHITKLTLTITKPIVMGLVFVVVVLSSVLTIISKQMENKVTAKTRITSAPAKRGKKKPNTREEGWLPLGREKEGPQRTALFQEEEEGG